MGKGGKGGSKGAAKGAAVDEDALLAAAIAENAVVKEKMAADDAEKKKQAEEAAKKGLQPEDLVKKLNAIPSFTLLNRNKDIVPLKDPKDPTGERELCCWFTDAREAKETLEAVLATNPTAKAAGLHLGVTPLGVAYGICVGWVECHFFGDKVIRGSQEPFTGETQDPTEMLRSQATSQGMESPGWHLPVFCCDELQSGSAMPVFFSRKALAEAWVTSGRKLADIPPNMAVLDLGVLLHQMQSEGVFAWSTVQFICERKSVQLVQESKLAAAQIAAEAQANAAAVAAAGGKGGGGKGGGGAKEEDDVPALQ